MIFLLLFVLLYFENSEQFDKIELEDVTINFPLKINYLASFSCATGTSCDDEGCGYIPAAAKVAIDRINKNEELEVFHNLTINFIDTTFTTGPRATSEIAKKNDTIAVMGLSKNCYIESTILNINSKIGVSDVCQMDLSSVKGFDQTTILLNSATSPLSKSVLYFLKKYNWNKVAIVSPSTTLSSFDSRVRSDLLDVLFKNNIDILLDSRIDPLSSETQITSKAVSDSQKARIFIICDWSKNANLVRNYLFRLGELNRIQSGEYFIIAYISYDANFEWIETEDSSQRALYLGVEDVGDFNITENELRTIYRNVLILSDGPPPSTAGSTWDTVKRNILSESKTKICPPYCDKNISSSVKVRWDRVKLFFDSIQFLAESTNDSLNIGTNIYDPSAFYEFMISRELKSISGVSEFIDGFGSVVGSMQVYYYFQSTLHNSYNLFPCGRMEQQSLLNDTWQLENYEEPLEINFINGTAPPDVPKCGFNMEKCGPPPDPTLVILVSIGSTLLIGILIIAAIIYKRYRYELRLHSLSFLIERNQIILKKHVNLMSQRSLRSMASLQGSFVAASETLQNSTFLLQDYQPNEGSQVSSRLSNTSTARLGSMVGPGAFQPNGMPEIPNGSNETTDDLRWHSLSDFAVGFYREKTVGLKRIYKSDVELTRIIRKEIAQVQELSHPNICGFLGMVIQSPDVFIVYDLAHRGSLKDILDNDDLPLDDIFMKQMTKDIVAGLEYLHNSKVGGHGRLKTSNCLIDSRWMVRLSSFGFRNLRYDENPIREGVQDGRDDLWTSPELLRWSTGIAQCTTFTIQKSDIYALAFVIYEIFGRAGPWGEEPMEPKEIVNRVKNGDELKHEFRPDLKVVKDAPVSIQETIAASWVENPMNRPSILQVKRKLKNLTAGLKQTIMDNMVAMVEKYTEKLEKDIAERNAELEEERQKSEMLLRMMLPDIVAERLKRGANVPAESFSSVTVFFSDCPGFAELSAESEPIQIVQFLNDLYTCFDEIISNFDVYKVETIADSYMVVSGLPIANGKHHAGEIASMALALLKSVESFKIRHRPGDKVRLRIGMNSGPCVAGVVGLKMPRYCLFGDTVNTASRMESNGIPLRINCSETSKQILDEIGGYELEERGLVEMKGKGKQMTYFVRSEDKNSRRERIRKDRVKYATLRKAVVDDNL